MDLAKRLTFDRNVSVRTVTISGEDFRPTGVLTGGSRSTKSAMLSDLAAVSSKYERLQQIDGRIREIDGWLYCFLY
jgi:structural maintenance of chromosome 2